MGMSETDMDYRAYTKPSELHKAINMLRGIVAGISCSDGVSSVEIQELVHWCSIHANLRERHPFAELLPTIERCLEDGIIDDNEKADILWLCSNFVDNSKYYDIVTSSIQFLHGLIHGIASDGKISDDEIRTLNLWLDTNTYLHGTYPFDELHSLIHCIIEDGVVTDEERNALLAFFSNLIEFKDSYNLSESQFEALREKYSVSGICAFDPNVVVNGKSFCFTGSSYRATRSEMESAVERLGGTFKSSVSKHTDYLIVGNAGNPCWAYSCYGRKIEEALALRKDGARLQIINEVDFWKAVEECHDEADDFDKEGVRV